MRPRAVPRTADIIVNPLSTQPAATTTNTQTVAVNSFWYGLELIFSTFAALITSILVARVVGPVRLGPFNYIVWLTNVTSAVGSFGLPMTTRKYMAEHFNQGGAAVAHAIYRFALKLQMLIAAGTVGLALAAAVFLADPGYHWISVLLVLNMGPRMIGYIPSQANNAAEMMRRNTAPAVIGNAVNIGLTLISLWVGWGLAGVAASVTIGSALELALKLRSVHSWLSPMPVGAVTPDLKRRLFSYSGQGVVLMLLNVVVWDRSDMIILKTMNHDIRQVAFFSIAFNLADRLLKLPDAFGQSLSVTMMAQYGRGRERLQQYTVIGAKYTVLLALPLLAGTACVSGPVVALLYGEAYRPLVPVLTATCVMGIAKAMIGVPTSLLQTTENQGFLIWTGCIFGAVDIGLDLWLTPGHGALGAALANGIAQAGAATAIWIRVHRIYRMDAAFQDFLRIALSGAAMVGVVLGVGYYLHGYAGVALSVAAGALVWFVSLRATGALDVEDRDRLMSIGQRLPGRLRPLLQIPVNFITPNPGIRPELSRSGS